MRRELLFNAKICEEGWLNVDYYLTSDKAADSSVYGVGLVMTHPYTCSGEFSYARGISRDRGKVVKILEILHKGTALPSTLADIIDDYLAEFPGS